MDYTEISKEFDEEYYELFSSTEKFKVKIARDDPVKFAYYMLGKRLWKHQVYLIRKALENRYNVWCLPRQTGKSITIAVLALWVAWFNKYSNSQNERLIEGCKVYIMSRTEDQAKELLLRIRELIRDGDAHMSKLLRHNAKQMTDFYSSQITEPNNKFQISFKNGSSIKCVPPTDSVRGKSADWFFIDEAAFLKPSEGDPDTLYYEAVEPTIRQTDGKMILSSTPRGQSGFFYRTLDPFEHFAKNEWSKVWFHYNILKSVSESHYQELVEKEKKMRSDGNGKRFEQEYEAKFVSSTESFFDNVHIDNSTNSEYKKTELLNKECVLGVDYGMVQSRTALAISYYDYETGKIITPYVKRFESGKDLNDVVPFIAGLMNRFNITKIVVDDCPEGFSINNTLSKRWNTELFSFSKSKSETYCSYRNYMNRGRIGILPDKDLLMEMKGLQQEETINGTLKIYKGGGLTDDLCDALIMSAKQWLTEENDEIGVCLV